MQAQLDCKAPVGLRDGYYASDEWSLTFDAVSDLIVILDNDRRIMRINRAMAERLGVKSEGAIGEPFYRIIHQADSPPTDCPRMAMLKAGEEASREVYYPCLGGWFNVSVVPLRDNAGRLCGSIHVAREITARKRAAEMDLVLSHLGFELSAARNLDEALKAALTAALAIDGIDCGGFYLLDRESGFLELKDHLGFSESFVRQAFRYPKDASYSQWVKKGDALYGANTRIGDLPADPAFVAEGILAIGVAPIHHRKQVIGSLSVGSRKFASIPGQARKIVERIARLIGGTLDRIKAEQRLRESEARYRLLAENTTDMISRHRADGTIVYLSPACRDILGYEVDDLLGNDPYAIVHPDDVDDLKASNAAILNPPHRESLCYRCKRKDGAYVWVRSNGCAIPAAAGGFEIVLSTRDVSAEKKIEDALKDARNLLETRVQERTATLMQVNNRLINEIEHRKTAEDALKYSEHEKTAILDAIQERVIFHDLEQRIIWVNRSAAAAAGRTPDQLVGRRCFELWGSGQQPCAACPVVECLQDSRPHMVERSLPDGRTVTIHGYPFFNENGELIGAVEVTADITEKRQTLEALKSERDRTRQYLDLAGVMILELDRDGCVTSINRRGCQILGTPEDQVVGKNWFDHFIPEKRRRYRRALFERTMDDILQTAGPLGFDQEEFWICAADGSPKYIAWKSVVLQDGSGQATGILSSGEDITQHKLAEEQLLRSKQQLQTVFDGISDPLIMLDADMCVKMLNRAALIYLDREAYSEVIGTPCEAIAWDPSFPDQDYRTATMQRGLRHHFTRKNAQAPNLTEQVDVFPLPGRKGRDGGVVIHIADITEKLSMEKQLIQADRLSSLGQMAGGIAHEIRNPLTGVRLFMDILSDPERFAIAPQQKEIMDEITENIVKIEGIIRRVLDLAKQKKPSMERIAVNDLIRKTLILWQARINKARIRLELELDSAIPVVQGDWIEIQQVLTNLVSNALEAMDAGGRLSIATRSGPSSLHPERQVVNIAVSDSGPGFSEDARRNVFTPFFTTKSAGTGLGLAISHKIIERHGGLIAVANHPEGGARFTIELNVAGA